TMVFAVVPVASAVDGPGLTPESVEAVVFPGGDYVVEKTVHTPELPPKLDVCLIVDLSGSYGDDLPNIKMLAPGIWDDIVAGGVSDLQMGLASFVDFPFNEWGDFASGDYAYRLDQQLTPTKATWVAAVNAMATTWGYDEPESQYEAFYQVATGAGNDVEEPGTIPTGQQCNFREDATKVAMLTTDASFHNAGDGGGPFPYPGASAVDTTNALVDGDITVIGLKAPGAGGELDALAAATGGAVELTTSTSSDIADAILAALKAIDVDVSMESDCSYPISTTFSPDSLTVESGEDAVFVETIAVAADAPGGTYECVDWALINGEPMLDDAGLIIYEYKTIKVPEGFLTGGGQIGKAKTAQNFGGNVGFLDDFSIVGQWQFRDGATKLNMHSLSIDYLQFYMIGGDPADPPTANANAAEFGGTARVKDGKAKWIDTCTFNAWAEDHGEPDVADAFWIYIDCGTDGIWDYGHDVLDTGNLQIHSGYKG
ncbi:MAG: hypothetical protein U9N79_10115, partial [Actinomycetota bacterium]|nr:hypothetical protein [Actinomycetota bacterium]